jgi:MFS family permease
MRELFRHRDFTLLFFGRVVTNVGDSLYYIAAMWLVYKLTGSTFYTGLAGFLILVPQTLQFLFGPLVDRVSVRRLLVSTQVAQGVLVLVIPIAWMTDTISVWVLLVIMPLLALLNQPVYPAETAALPRIVERDELVTANSLFTFAYQGIDAAFNALGGLLVAAIGAVSLFVIDSVTFAAATVLFALLRIRTAKSDSPGETDVADNMSETDVADNMSETDVADNMSETDVTIADGGASKTYIQELRSGIGFLRGTIIERIIVGSVVVNFALGGVMAVLPAYGDQLGGSEVYGLLVAAMGGGLLGGALLAGALDRFPFGTLAICGLTVSAIAWTVAVAVSWLPATVGLLALAFVPVGVVNVLIISLVQALVPEGILGRVTAVLSSASAGMTPIGALVGGSLASTSSPTLVLWFAGGSFAVLAVYLLAVPSLRRLPRVDAVSTLTTE